MDTRCLIAILFFYTTTVVATDNQPSSNYYQPNEDPDRIVLWKGLFTKLNALTLAVDKISQNVMDLNKRQENQENQMAKLVDYATSNSREIVKLREAVEINAKYLKDVHLESRLKGLESKMSQITVSADQNTKYLNEIRSESNKRSEDQGIQIVQFAENFKSNTKVLNESLLRLENQGNLITEMQGAYDDLFDLSTKLVNDARSEFNLKQDSQAELINKLNPQWTTILRRQDGSVDFQRNWTDYQKGFGNPPYGEFFIGLDKLHEMTKNQRHELVVVLKDWDDTIATANYDYFEIGGPDEKYAIKVVGNYTGEAGDSLTHSKGAKFTTLDADNDKYGGNCAAFYGGAWWHKYCSYSVLTGPYRKEHEKTKAGLRWYYWKNTYDYSYKFAEMKVRPVYVQNN